MCLEKWYYCVVCVDIWTDRSLFVIYMSFFHFEEIKDTRNSFFLKKYTGTWKNVHLHYSLEKYKSKSQWGTTSCPLGWLLFKKNPEISNVGKDMEKLEAACTAGRDMNWCRHQRTAPWFRENLNIELPWNRTASLLGLNPEDLKAGGCRTCTYEWMLIAACMQ